MQSPSRPSSGPRLAKGATACQRCRRRKQKCDLKYPNCSNCESAHVLCLTYHSSKQAEIPRNYVSNLEAQVEKLTRENEELRAQNQVHSTYSERTTSGEIRSPAARRELSAFPTASPATSDASSSHLQDLVKSVRNVVVEPSREARFLGQSSGITLARLVMAAIRVDALPPLVTTEQRPHTAISAAPAAEASLPPRHAAEHLVEVYFQYRTPHLPIVGRSQVEEALENAYSLMTGQGSGDRAVEQDIFTTYMIFAIALCDVVNPGGGRPSQSEGCFRSALGWIEKVITYSKSDLETLRAILLLAQFVALHPARGSLWHLTGVALRLCIDIGLHWETEEQSFNMDPDVLHERRRLWWSTYQFDRVLCITLGRPVGIIDESTSVPLPNPSHIFRGPLGRAPNEWSTHHQIAHNHLFRMSKLESEIKSVLHSQAWEERLASPRADYAAWVQDIQPRLQEWYATIPTPNGAHPSSIFAHQAYWDAIYNNSVLLLYRPASVVLDATAEELFISFEASCKLIASIKTLQRDGKIDVLWQSVHHLFMAGLGVIYGLWHSNDLRTRNPVSKSISTLQSCASTLSALSESFPGAAGCRDAFDTLSAATIDWLVTHKEEDINHNRLQFEKQVEDLLQLLQQQPSSSRAAAANESSAGNVGNVGTAALAADNFAFSEMLSSAAQWPEFQDLDFSDLAPDPITGIGPGFHNSASFTF